MMMGGYGFGWMGGFGLFGIFNLLLIGFVVYFAVKLALKDSEKKKLIKKEKEKEQL